MIRKSDSFVNATQILRAAGLPKPARTKVLDRQVARGVHEKVQGGYAGSQGTWVPLDTAKELARTYGILNECLPLFDYDMASGTAELTSPPIKIRRTISKAIGSDLESSGGNHIFFPQKTKGMGFNALDDDGIPRKRTIIHYGDYGESLATNRETRESKKTRRGYQDDDDEEEDVDFDERKKAGSSSQHYSRAVATVGHLVEGESPIRKCYVCGVTETPQWRRGPSGKRTLCNACGVKWSTGRLKLNASPGSPFPFTTTDTDQGVSSDGTTGFEEIEVGSTAWKLQIEVARLKSKLREVQRNHKRLNKLLSEITRADRQIDRSYRSIISSAKRSNPQDWSPLKNDGDLFHKDIVVPTEVHFGNETEQDRVVERSLIENFKSAVSHSL